MPCYQVNYISQEFNVHNVDLLRKTAEKMGVIFRQYGNQVTVGDCQVDLQRKTITGTSQKSINNIKQSFSKEAVKQAARKTGWTLQTKKENVFVATKY